jgi:hypothetical protein
MSNMDDEERKYRERMAQISKYVHSTEFEGQGKVLKFNFTKRKWDDESDFAKKYGARYVWTVIDEYGIERLVAPTAHSLMRGIDIKLSQRPKGTDVKLHIWKLGPGTQSYKVEYAN